MSFARTVATSVLVALAACGGSKGGAAPASPTAAADREYAATQWIPARPTYAFAARTLRESQRGARDLLDGLGAPFGLTAGNLAHELSTFLGVDILSDTAVGGIGIDLDASIAVFSDGANPTLVARLADPARLEQFLEERRARGMNTQSVVVDGIEVYTAKVRRTAVSWALADGWFFLHFQLPFGKDDSATWFASTRAQRTGAKPWAATWDWARAQAGTAVDGIVGFADPAAILASLKQIEDAQACVALASPIQRIAFGVEADGLTTRARLAFDVGAASTGVAAATKPLPAGWTATGAAAPLAVELNVDLAAAAQWLGPCLRATGADPTALAQYGVTSGRAILLGFDPDDMMSSTGVVSVDLAHKRYLAGMLDQIPMRSMAEKRRQFGSYPGHRLSIPFGPTVDYILTDAVGFAAAGDGVLERAVGTGAPVPGALARFDVRFDAMPAASWAGRLDLIDEGFGARFEQGFGRWQEAHASLSLDGSALVLDATATRR